MFDRSPAAYSARARRIADNRAATGRNRNGWTQGHPTTSDRLYSAEETQFMLAMEEFKRKSGRRFPTWSEALGVLHGLGYVRIVGAEGLGDRRKQERRAS